METEVEPGEHKTQNRDPEQLYEDQYKIYVLPYVELAKESSRMADIYTQLIVRTLFLLNGGAIAIIPALSAFKTEHMKPDILILSLALFAIGLCFSMAFTLACRHNLHIEADMFDLGAEQERRQIARRVGLEHTNRPPIRPFLKTGDLKTSARKLRSIYLLTYSSAYVFGVFSFGAFVSGILLASKAMLGGWVYPTEILRLLIN